MLKRVSLLILLFCLSLIAQAQDSGQPPPPAGLYDALNDLNSRLGLNVTLNCTDPARGETCATSDLRMNWSWSNEVFPDASLGCPSSEAAAQVQTRAFAYRLTWDGVVYEYRQLPDGGLYLCDDDTAITTEPPQPTTIEDTCPLALPPQLIINDNGRVTPGAPNNIRSAPGTSQTLLGQIPGGGEFKVLDGPTCANGVIYWLVDYQGIIGWTGESDGSGYWVEPLAASAPNFSTAPDLPAITPDTLPQLDEFATLTATGPLAWSDYGLMAITKPFGPTEDDSYEIWVYDVGAQIAEPKILAVRGFAQQVAFGPLLQTAPIAILVRPLAGDAVIELWDAFTGTQISTLNLPVNTLEPIDLAYSPTQPHLTAALGSPLSGQGIYEIVVWDFLSGSSAANRYPQADFVSSLAYSPDGNLLAAAIGPDVVLFDVASMSEVGRVAASVIGLDSALAFSPDGTRLAVASGDVNSFFASVINAATVSLERTFAADTQISGLAFNADGTILAVSQSEIAGENLSAGVQLWDLNTGTALGFIPGSTTGYFYGPSFNPDGTIFAVIDADAIGSPVIRYFSVQ